MLASTNAKTNLPSRTRLMLPSFPAVHQPVLLTRLDHYHDGSAITTSDGGRTVAPCLAIMPAILLTTQAAQLAGGSKFNWREACSVHRPIKPIARQARNNAPPRGPLRRARLGAAPTRSRRTRRVAKDRWYDARLRPRSPSRRW